MPEKSDSPGHARTAAARRFMKHKRMHGEAMAPIFCPGLSGFWVGAKFRVVVCSECGATQFFADEQSRAKLAQSDKWKRL